MTSRGPVTGYAATGQPVTVHVSVNYNKITLTGTGLVPLPDKIQGVGTMSKEGPPNP